MENKLVRILLITLVGLGGSIPAWSQTETENHERWYQVEILIFARPESNRDEHWSNDVKLAYPANLRAIPSGEGETAIVSAPIGLLTKEVSGLAKYPSYSILFHQAWRQKIFARKTQLLISGGKTFNGHQELEGSIALSVGQYLKLQTNLWLTQFAPAGTDISEPWPALPSLNATKDESAKPSDSVITRIVKLNQNESMRSNEVHYLDHPLVGIFIKIIPSN